MSKVGKSGYPHPEIGIPEFVLLVVVGAAGTVGLIWLVGWYVAAVLG